MGNFRTVYFKDVYQAPDSYANPGGDEFEYFTDYDLVHKSHKLHEVVIYLNEEYLLCGIRFIYEQFHGVLHGKKSRKWRIFKLNEGEYITCIKWNSTLFQNAQNDFISNLEIITNQNRSYIFGKNDFRQELQHEIKVKDDQAIIGLSGLCYNKQITHINCALYVDVKTSDQNERFYYDDYFYLTNTSKVTKIICYSGIVVDKLQFIYDNDESKSVMHGNGVGGRHEFKLEYDEYIKKIIFNVAHVKGLDTYDAPTLCKITFITNKERKFITGLGNYENYEQVENYKNYYFTNRKEYVVEANYGEEIVGLSGVYTKYMGRPLSAYIRKINNRVLLSSEVESIYDDKEFLFIFQENKKDHGTFRDENVSPLVDLILRKLNDNKRFNFINKCSFLPDFFHHPDLRNDKIVIDNTMIERILLSGKYKYISFRCHGTPNWCGTYNAGLLNSGWVNKNANALKKSLKDTVIALNCCECACRLSDNYKPISSLAQDLANAGAKGVFGYSVAYIVNNYKEKDIGMSQVDGYNLRFHTLIDFLFLSNKDPNLTVFDLANNILKAMKDTADSVLKINQMEDPTGKLLKNGIKVTSKEELARDIARALYLDYKNQDIEEDRKNFTSDGDIRTTDGAMAVLNFAKEWLDKNYGKSYIISAYMTYLRMYIDYTHLCGPGESKSLDYNAKHNLGELCSDFTSIKDDKTQEL